MCRSLTDAGGIIVGWLLKVSLAIVVVAVLGYDLLSVAYTAVAVEDDARAVARSAATSVFAQESPEQMLLRAEETAASRGVDITDSTVSVTEEGAVVVTVSRTANTLVLKHIPPLRDYLTSDATVSFDTR